MDLTQFLALTVGGFFSLLLSGGINYAVAYVLDQTSLPDQVEKVLHYGAVLALSGLATYISTLIPQTMMNQSLVVAMAGLFSLGVNWAGAQMGQVKSFQQQAAIAESIQTVDATLVKSKYGARFAAQMIAKQNTMSPKK